MNLLSKKTESREKKITDISESILSFCTDLCYILPFVLESCTVTVMRNNASAKR